MALQIKSLTFKQPVVASRRHYKQDGDSPRKNLWSVERSYRVASKPARKELR